MGVIYSDMMRAIETISAAGGKDYLAVGQDETRYRHEVASIVMTTREANENAGRVMSYGATLAWGISIGILAERFRERREGFHGR